MKTMSGKTSSLPPPSLPLASHSIPQATLSCLSSTLPLPASFHSSSLHLLSLHIPPSPFPRFYSLSFFPSTCLLILIWFPSLFPLFLPFIQLASPISFAPFLSPLPFILSFLSFVSPSPFSLLHHIFLFLLHILFSLFLVFLVILHPWPRSLTFLQRLAGRRCKEGGVCLTSPSPVMF